MAKSNKPKDKQNLDYILVNDFNHIEKYDLSDDYIVMVDNLPALKRRGFPLWAFFVQNG